MEKIIVLSRCRRTRRKTGAVGVFGFQGFYRGQRIRRLELTAPDTGEFHSGEDYLLFVAVRDVVAEVLYGDVLRVRRL